MATTNELSWDGLLSTVRGDFPDLYRSWFDTLRPGTLVGGELRVELDDPHRARYLQDNCGEAFTQALMRQCGHLVSVRFLSQKPDQPTEIAGPGSDYLVPVPLNVDHTFEQFVVGESNRLAHAACRAVTADPGNLYNPLFIHGRSGLGKTHLLQAVCAELQQRVRGIRIAFVNCETFVNDYVRAIEKGQLPRFRDAARQAGALVIDDVQFLANRESSQEELFHTFNTLHESGRQIILSADTPPSDIPTLEDRLVSRFNWGLVAAVGPPSRETRQAILHKKAQLRGCDVPAEVLDFIAERVESNVRLLEGALTKLMMEATIGGKPMTLETAETVLSEYAARPSRPLQVNDILDTISAHFRVRLSDLVGRKRSRSVSFPRQIGMYLARKLTPLSLEEIGGLFGGRDHSTVLHAERVIDAERQRDAETAETLSLLTRQLLAQR